MNKEELKRENEVLRKKLDFKLRELINQEYRIKKIREDNIELRNIIKKQNRKIRTLTTNINNLNNIIKSLEKQVETSLDKLDEQY